MEIFINSLWSIIGQCRGRKAISVQTDKSKLPNTKVTMKEAARPLGLEIEIQE
jgi:hypothetical protein